jgi:hypothetical protein
MGPEGSVYVSFPMTTTLGWKISSRVSEADMIVPLIFTAFVFPVPELGIVSKIRNAKLSLENTAVPEVGGVTTTSPRDMFVGESTVTAATFTKVTSAPLLNKDPEMASGPVKTPLVEYWTEVAIREEANNREKTHCFIFPPEEFIYLIELPVFAIVLVNRFGLLLHGFRQIVRERLRTCRVNHHSFAAHTANVIAPPLRGSHYFVVQRVLGYPSTSPHTGCRYRRFHLFPHSGF